ncbi:MAG: aldehyde ferredoxin oxidoreductase family protein [Desulfobacterales bacterium]|nr:aldehyde ferredoxin oxidoreductase family protein [Desulfobacterales bacterium]MDJ0912367.1 aldehyde ferredoxin oxidoreductase family protein [Desulfobacterales bacterium]
MYGFYGRILTIDLNHKKFDEELLSDEIIASYLGGKGLATRLLLDRNPTGVDPLAPENHLIINTGPFCQSRLWGGSRYGVFTKSPLTGFYAEAYSGGKVPEAVDAAGYDAVILAGKAAQPTILSIHSDGVQFHEAGDLWGTDTYTAEKEALERFAPNKEGFRKPGAVVIGPAGEKLVRCALINNDKWRCAGRAGVGAVMGAKHLKGIVFQGDCKRELADPNGVAAYAKTFMKTHTKSPGVEAFRTMGTTMVVGLTNTVGAFPAKYWHQGTCDHWEKISGETYHQEHEIKPNACAKCFVACGRKAKLSKGRHKDLVLEGPEYETIMVFGGLCMVDDMAEIVYLNDICDRLGMDTITAGNLCGFTIEAKVQGRIDYDIDYGEVDKIADLLEKIAAREGIGNILADGIIPAARQWGAEDLAIHVKGMEPSGYDPRVLKGMGLSFGTSPRGACHLRTTFYKPELEGKSPPDQIEGKAEIFTDYEDRMNIFDTLILCRFYRDLYQWEDLQESIKLATGLSLSTEELRAMAADIATMTKQFNINEGWQSKDDLLPQRWHDEPLPSGSITEEQMNQMLSDYYRLRGWNSEGVPEGK